MIAVGRKVRGWLSRRPVEVLNYALAYTVRILPLLLFDIAPCMHGLRGLSSRQAARCVPCPMAETHVQRASPELCERAPGLLQSNNKISMRAAATNLRGVLIGMVELARERMQLFACAWHG